MQSHRPVVRHFVTRLRWRLYLGISLLRSLARARTQPHTPKHTRYHQTLFTFRSARSPEHTLSRSSARLWRTGEYSMLRRASVCVVERALVASQAIFHFHLNRKWKHCLLYVPNRCGRNVDKTVWGREKMNRKKAEREQQTFTSIHPFCCTWKKRVPCLGTCNCMCGNSIECVPHFLCCCSFILAFQCQTRSKRAENAMCKVCESTGKKRKCGREWTRTYQ